MKRKPSKGFGVYQKGIPTFTKPVPNGTPATKNDLPQEQTMTTQTQQFTSIRKLSQHKGVPYTTVINHLKRLNISTGDGVTPEVMAAVDQKWPDVAVPEVVQGGAISTIEVLPPDRNQNGAITFNPTSTRYDVLSATQQQIQALNAANQTLKSYLEATIMQANEMGAQVGAVQGRAFLASQNQSFTEALQRSAASQGIEQPGED